MIALLAGLGKIFVARMADRVGNVDRRVLLDNQPDQPFVDPHRHFADRIAIEADRRAQHQALALRIEQVERADLGLHSAGDRVDNLVEGLAQVVGMLTADGGKISRSVRGDPCWHHCDGLSGGAKILSHRSHAQTMARRNFDTLSVWSRRGSTAILSRKRLNPSMVGQHERDSVARTTLLRNPGVPDQPLMRVAFG